VAEGGSVGPAVGVQTVASGSSDADEVACFGSLRLGFPVAVEAVVGGAGRPC
jgi:acetyl/propionyl-CoA carboxylase alpha subunit